MSALRSYWLASLLAICLLGTTAVFVFARPLTQGWFQETSRHAGFVLSNLKIAGNKRTQEAEILALLDIDFGMPLMAIDLTVLQERIEALPWVRQATVSRVLPGDITIDVRERVPFALWQKEGKLRLIDAEGIVITRYGLTEFSELPMLVGEGAPSAVGALHQTLISAPEMAGKIKTLVRVGDRRWDLLFDSGIRIKLPDNSDRDYNSQLAWQRFVRLEKKHHLLAREVSVIDMRIKDRLIMRLTPAGRRMMAGKEWAT